jgi:hypothetical protein
MSTLVTIQGPLVDSPYSAVRGIGLAIVVFQLALEDGVRVTAELKVGDDDAAAFKANQLAGEYRAGAEARFFCRKLLFVRDHDRQRFACLNPMVEINGKMLLE